MENEDTTPRAITLDLRLDSTLFDTFTAIVAAQNERIEDLEKKVMQLRGKVHDLANDIASRPDILMLEMLVKQIMKDEKLKAEGLIGNNAVS